MEKFSSNNLNKETKKEENKKSFKLPMWVKASALSLGLASSSPVFSQSTENIQDDKNLKYDTELMQEISSFYHEASIKKEKSLDYLEYTSLTSEEKVDFKNYVKDEINKNEEIARNPELLYKKILEEVEECRSVLISHFSSVEFLDKLESSLFKEDALIKQQKIINNIKSVSVFIVSPSYLASLVNDAAGLYIIKEHKILIPFSMTMGEGAITHELLHAAYRATAELSEDEINTLHRLFKKNKDKDKDQNVYQHKASERIVRKKIFDIELERLGVKYGEKVTKEHWEMLQNLKKRHELGSATQDILNTITEKQFLKLMNTIAFEDSSKDKQEDLIKENIA